MDLLAISPTFLFSGLCFVGLEPRYFNVYVIFSLLDQVKVSYLLLSCLLSV